MSNIEDIHDQAMVLAQKANEALNKDDTEAYRQLSEQAFVLEKEAALQLTNEYDPEPTRSVLFRSAASLAFNAGLYSDAQQMASLGLSGNPFYETKLELEDLLDNIPETTATREVFDSVLHEDPIPYKREKQPDDLINVPKKNIQKKKVFISYSRYDVAEADKIRKHLRVLQDEIETFYDQDIVTGEKWDDEVKKRMQEADIVIFLLSVHLLNSEYFLKTEMSIVQERLKKQDGLSVIPIMLKNFNWRTLRIDEINEHNVITGETITAEQIYRALRLSE